MTQINQIYKCNICGNIIEMVHAGAGQLVCCGQPMILMSENTIDAAIEKHKPIISKIEGGYKIDVGSTPHPMVAEHYIEWIEIIVDNITYKKFLKPDNAPSAEFMVKGENAIARAYCNLHGLWS